MGAGGLLDNKLFWDGNSSVSKFGGVDGSNANGPKREQASVDGFRLDSSQSSWLMDRLGALDEEDKMSLSSSAAQVQMSDNHVDRTPYQNQQQAQRFEQERPDGSHLKPVQTPHPQNQTPPQPQHTQAPTKKTLVDTVLPQLQLDQRLPQQGGEPRDIDSEIALLLRQKIENLEQQLAEISDLTSEQRARYVEELSQPQGRGPVGPPHLRGEDIFEDQAGFVEDASYQNQHSSHDQHQPQGAPVNRGLDPHYASQADQAQFSSPHEGHLPVRHVDEYGHEPVAMEPDYSDQPHHSSGVPHQGGANYHAEDQGYFEQVASHETYAGNQIASSKEVRHVEASHRQVGHTHMHHQHGGQVQQSQQQQEYSELPQFLAPVQQEKKGRPAYVAVFGSVVALLIAGGVAYTYLNGGVSDVVKSDLSSSGFKEPSKLSDAGKQVEQPAVKEVEIARVEPEVNINQRFSVASIAGTAGQNVPFKIQLPNDKRLSSAFLVVRNLPDWAKLNYGRQMNGLWMVSVSQVNDLEMIVPEDQPGKFAFEIDLVVNAGDAPVTKKVQADIAPYKAPEPRREEQPEVASPPSEEKQEVASLETEAENSDLIKQPGVGAKQGTLIIDQALEEKWLERGTRLLRAGDVSAARLAFSHLAEQGSGRAALAMGMTFDPNQPSARVVSGIKLDKDRARFWYQRALSLGHEGARDPLRQLDRK